MADRTEPPGSGGRHSHRHACVAGPRVPQAIVGSLGCPPNDPATEPQPTERTHDCTDTGQPDARGASRRTLGRDPEHGPRH